MDRKGDSLMKKILHFMLIIVVLIAAIGGTITNFSAGTFTSVKFISLSLLLIVATLLTYSYRQRYPSDRKVYSLVGIIVAMTIPIVIFALVTAIR